MKARVVDDGAGGWRLAENASYRARSDDASAASMPTRIERRKPDVGAFCPFGRNRRLIRDRHGARRGHSLPRQMTGFAPAQAPTLYFFGVTTTKSSIMMVFPSWAKELGLADAVVRGVDFPLHAPAATYRSAVEFLKHDPLSLGALVTTHKIDLYEACRDQFDEIDVHARLMGETSCLSKRDGRLICHAKDPISSGLALDGFLPERYFERSGAEVFSMGAGGSTIALTWHLMQRHRGADRPSRILVSEPQRGETRRDCGASITSLARARRSNTCWRRSIAPTTPCLPV